MRWYHAIFGAYGFWLPNDPRGSWSDFVHSYELFKFGGPATKVTGKRSYAHDPHDAAKRREAKEHLKFPPARFTGAARSSIAAGFESACTEFGFVLYACAIGFDHVHLVTGRDPSRSVEQVVAVLKARTTRQMNHDNTHPMPRLDEGSRPTPWAKRCWTVFIDTRDQLRNAVRYVERHPSKEGLAPQPWQFARPVAETLECQSDR